jgi:succinate-semialdehyde dehydrogenase/glutarate-semialdehyde dehydrogenase
MLERTTDLAFLLSLETGKPLRDARAEVGYAAEFFRWFSEETVRIDGTLRTAPSGSNRILTLRKPVGVALLLTPWNFPAAMVTRKIGPALASGCTVVLKPAEDTPLIALALAHLLQESGAPPGTINVLPTDNPAGLVTRALRDSRVRKLSFTGSTEVGRILLRQAADRVVNVSMELGGNNPFIVLEDADLEAAVEGAMLAKMRNGGQACTAANHFLVHASLVERFTEGVASRMSQLRMGGGTDQRTELGPLINRRAIAGIAEKVERTVAAGAKLALGGKPSKRAGFFYPATVVTEVPRDSPLATEEVFGPVAPIIPIDGDDDALELANASDMGLTGYVYTGSMARGLRLLEGLDVGMAGLNRGLVSDPAAPFGGVKQSGIGREGGYEGIDDYLETMYVAAAW